MLVVVDQVLPLKLYAVVCNHTPASIASVILKVHVVHSGHESLLNVNVGHVASYVYAFEVHVHTFPTKSIARKFKLIFTFGVILFA